MIETSSAQIPPVQFFSIFLVIFIGGGLGGFTEFIRSLYIDNKVGDAERENLDGMLYYNQKLISFSMIFFLGIIGAVIGSASAISLQFILILLDASKLAVDAKSELFNLSISVAAGFGGRRILPKMSDRIEQSFIDVEARKEAEAANEVADEANETAENASENAEQAALYSQIQDAMSDGAIPSTRSQLIFILGNKVDERPLHRKYNIWLGRLLFREKKIEEAVQVIDRFLEKKRQADEPDKDYADLNFNKACYLAQKFGRTGDEESMQGALDALETSLSISNENLIDAISDNDLAPLRDLPKFLEITKAP